MKLIVTQIVELFAFDTMVYGNKVNDNLISRISVIAVLIPSNLLCFD